MCCWFVYWFECGALFIAIIACASINVCSYDTGFVTSDVWSGPILHAIRGLRSSLKSKRGWRARIL